MFLPTESATKLISHNPRHQQMFDEPGKNLTVGLNNKFFMNTWHRCARDDDTRLSMNKYEMTGHLLGQGSAFRLPQCRLATASTPYVVFVNAYPDITLSVTTCRKLTLYTLARK